MTTMYACNTTTLLHSIAIRQNRTIEKGGNEREHTYTYKQTYCERRQRIKRRVEIKTKREYNEYNEWKKADGVMSTNR